MPGIYNLNDLFYALFHAEEKQTAVIAGFPGKLNREDYFQMFFPEELCRPYLEKTKANLTWFFNNDVKNKAIKNTLRSMLKNGTQPVVAAVHQKCKTVLYPQGQHPAFDRGRLWQVLDMVVISANLNARLRIKKQAANPEGEQYALPAFFEADPSAALARMILTLALLPPKAEADTGLVPLLGRLWQIGQRDEQEPDCGDIPGRVRYGNMLYLSGNHEKAFAVYESIANFLGRPAQTQEESAMYCRMGQMLSSGDGHCQDKAAARGYLEKGCHDGNPESFYLLAKLCQGEKARALLEKAAELGSAPARRELGNAWYYGTRGEASLQKALEWFSRVDDGTSADFAYCAYMRGRILEELSDQKAAVQMYRMSAEAGNAEALRRLDEMSVFPEAAPDGRTQPDGGPQRYCWTNAMTGDNIHFAASLSESWQVVSGPENGTLAALVGQLYSPEAGEFPELVIALLSADQDDNLLRAVDALKTLEIQARALGTRKRDMARKIMIYVEAEFEYASLMLDAAYASVRSVTIALRLCDPARDSADALFASAPLFLPCLRDPDAEKVHLVILGTSDTAMAVVQRAISMPLSEKHPVTISVIGENAGDMERAFQEKCPGVYSAAPGIRRSIPVFRECALGSGEITALLREQKQSRMSQKKPAGNDIASLLERGNYFVIATDSDKRNIRLGTCLRTELLKLYPSFANLPFIAVHVHDGTIARLAANLSVQSKSRAYCWYTRYDLFCFGSSEQYTCRNLREDLIEKRSRAVHLLYAGNSQPEYLAMESYYRRQYNRDSSRAAALYLGCCLYLAGIALPDWRLYGSPEEAALAPRYRAWAGQQENAALAARLEHERWNCYMLASGWEQASVSQVETYVMRGNPSHQLYLGKLHPFLCPWEELASGGLLEQITQILRSRLPEATVTDPRISDAQIVQAVPSLITIR